MPVLKWPLTPARGGAGCWPCVSRTGTRPERRTATPCRRSAVFGCPLSPAGAAQTAVIKVWQAKWAPADTTMEDSPSPPRQERGRRRGTGRPGGRRRARGARRHLAPGGHPRRPPGERDAAVLSPAAGAYRSNATAFAVRHRPRGMAAGFLHVPASPAMVAQRQARMAAEGGEASDAPSMAVEHLRRPPADGGDGRPGRPARPRHADPSPGAHPPAPAHGSRHTSGFTR